jgi:hypothetical protein
LEYSRLELDNGSSSGCVESTGDEKIVTMLGAGESRSEFVLTGTV